MPMKNTRKTKNKLHIVGLLLMLTLLVGCGNFGQDGGAGNTQDTQQDLLEGTRGLFLILEHNTTARLLTLYSYETGEEYEYFYQFSTKFFDKYGKNEPRERFTVGRVIELDAKDTQGYLTGVHISDEVWEKKDIVRFAHNEKEQVFTIGTDNYSTKLGTRVFSGNEQIEFSDLWERDVINVVGQGSQILSVTVTKGHGVLKLVNTSLFDGSLFNIGDSIFNRVEEGVEINVPEGTYAFTVAKDGWGSTTEITITRGETTVIDLDTVKGEGPKKGLVTFRINIEDVKVYIDYKEVDHTKPIELVYGTHVLEIAAPGYTSWRGKIVVGSPSYEVSIELEEESDDPVESTEGDKKDTEKDKDKDKDKNSGKDSASVTT